MGLFNRNQTTQRRPIRTVRTERSVDNSDLQYKAKSKLIGAVVLAFLGAVILPFVFSNDEPINQAENTLQAPLVSPSAQVQGGAEGNISISAAPGVLAGEANTGAATTGAVVTNPAGQSTEGTAVSGAVDGSDLAASTQVPQSIASSVGNIPQTNNTVTDTAAPSVAQGTNVPDTNPETSSPVATATEDAATTSAPAEKVVEAKRKETTSTKTTKETKESKRTNTIKDENRTDDGSVALALLEGRSPSQAKASPKATASVKKGSYSVQVAAFSSMDEARAQRDRLSSSGVSNAFVQSAVVNGRQTYRLRVGPFTSQESAQAALTRLRGLGHSGFITGN